MTPGLSYERGRAGELGGEDKLGGMKNREICKKSSLGSQVVPGGSCMSEPVVTVTVVNGPSSPDSHVHPLVFNPLHVEADGGDRGHNLVEVELVLRHRDGDRRGIRIRLQQEKKKKRQRRDVGKLYT